MAKTIVTPFASSGDRTAVPDTTQSNGAVNYADGYGPQYSEDITTSPTARRIDRDPFNQLGFDTTSNIQEWQRQFAPDFIPEASNGGTAVSYPLGMIVWDGAGYRRSRVANNTAVVTDNTNWEDYDFSGATQATETQAGIAEIATQVKVDAGADDLAFITSLKLSTRLSALGVSAYSERTASFTSVLGGRYTITATATAVDATLPSALVVGSSMVFHNNANSTMTVRILNTLYTIRARSGSITTSDNLVLDPGDSAVLVAVSSNILEIV